VIVADHELVSPGETSILDEHFDAPGAVGAPGTFWSAGAKAAMMSAQPNCRAPDVEDVSEVSGLDRN
jgi:hypothetical protein